MKYLTDSDESNKRIVNHVCTYIKANTDVAVIGLSGGADSTLVATLCAIALGKENVIGVSMPCGETDTKTFNGRSRSLADYLGIHHMYHSISDVVDSFTKEFCLGTAMSPINAGNLRSRTRMMFLYATAAEISESGKGKQRVRVIGTGNLSEDFIGYDTKGGDSLADFFPVGELYKQEIYDLLDFLAAKKYILPAHIDRVPSAGLWEGQTDEGELGYTYAEMAPAIELFRTSMSVDSPFPENFQGCLAPVVQFVKDRHIANRHKHMAPAVCNTVRQRCAAAEIFI